MTRTLDELKRNAPKFNDPEEISTLTTPKHSHSAADYLFDAATQAEKLAEQPITHDQNSISIEIVDKRSALPRAGLSDEIEKAKKQIINLRSGSDPTFLKNAKVAEFVAATLQKRGVLYHDTVRGYVFLKNKRLLLPLDDDEQGLELVLFDYGLYPADPISRYVVDGLRLTALQKGSYTEVHAFSYFDRRRLAVYVYDFAGGVYIVRPEGIEHADNGTDGVLFIQNPKWRAFELPRYLKDTMDWQAWLLDGINFAHDELSADDSGLLLRLWVLSLFFPQRFPTRAILALVGQKGSGKSSLLRRLGQLLFGPEFQLTALTTKPDDFDALITTDPLVVADNADDAPPWLADKLAVAATGGSVKRRSYYTTNRLVDFPIRATLAITSRTPNFQREDVAERLLPLKLNRLEDFGPENALLADVQGQRNVLLAGIVRDVFLAVNELQRAQPRMDRSRFRLADFGDFALKVGPVFGKQTSDVKRLLCRLTTQQGSFATQDDQLFPLIDQWLAHDGEHVNIEREISTSDLGIELEALAAQHGVPWDRGNARSFGQYLRARAGTLTTRYQMESRSGHGGVTLIRLKAPKHGDLGELGVKPQTASFYQYEFEKEGGLK